eukprot:9170361-Alexandrium_andersonii.AAC.1
MPLAPLDGPRDVPILASLRHLHVPGPKPLAQSVGDRLRNLAPARQGIRLLRGLSDPPPNGRPVP